MCKRKLLLQVKKGLIKAIDDELAVTEGVKLIETINEALGLDVYDSTVPKPKPAVVCMPRELLEEIKIALMIAIADEDGLDGNAGMVLIIEAINPILGRDKKDFTIDILEAREGVGPCLGIVGDRGK